MKVQAQIAGTVAFALVDSGDTVVAGEDLIVTDSPELRAADDAAKAAWDGAERKLEALRMRQANLEEQIAVEGELEIAMQARRENRTRREQLRVAAPCPGVVTQIHVISGKPVRAGDELIELVDTSSYTLRADLPPSNDCKPGAWLMLRTPSGPPLPHTWAVVTEVGVFGPTTSLVTIHARVMGDLSTLRPDVGVYAHLVAGPATRP